MSDRINDFFRFSEQAVNVRHERQKILTSNIANSDTPGYKARDIDFGETLQKVQSGQINQSSSFGMNATNKGHIQSNDVVSSFIQEAVNYRQAEQASLDGNTVDLDVERANFLDNSMKYQADMNFLNSKIRSLRAAMKE